MNWVLSFSLILALGATLRSSQDFRSRYQLIQSYEIRPGVLATPKYGSNGTLCEVSVEKRHVQGDTVDLGATMPRKLMLNIANELAPDHERGQPTHQFGRFDYENVSGSSAVTIQDYAFLSIHIYRATSESGDTAMILQWKNAACPRL